MPAKKYKVTLTTDEREHLMELISKGKAAARKLAHARILLACDETDGCRGASDTGVAQAVHVGRSTVESEARLIALACSSPPEGRAKWTLRLLAERLVELEVFESISTETVRQTLKKTNLSLG